MKTMMAIGCLLLCVAAFAEVSPRGVPAGCDPAVMSEAYWKIWTADEQATIDVDIERNRKADGVFAVDAPEGTEVTFEQLDHDFRFGAHIFNFNQLGSTEYNDAYKASYGRGGIFNQATVAFYWNNYEPTPGKLRANGSYEDTEDYWNGLTAEQAMLDRNWRRPAPGPVIDFLKSKDVAIHGHILLWGLAKPYWIYDWYCPEREKRAFDALGIPRHSTSLNRARAGAESNFGFAKDWRKAWIRVYETVSEEEIAKMAPVFTANMRRIFRKRVFDVAGAFGDVVDSWDVVNESSRDWTRYRKSRTGLPVWKSGYGLMPGDYPLHALLDAKEAMSSAAKLAINDYNVGDDFLKQVQDLEGEGAKVDIVGCQMHIFDTNDCRRLADGATDVKWVGTPQIIQDRLDTMAKTGKPLHVSEITITSPGADAASRQVQAILTRNIYRKWFSHRAMMGITWWNTVDGGGVYGEPTVSGLFTRDLRKKPAYLALDELINGEWKTKGRAKVEGRNRTVSFRGFRGKYRLSWRCANCGGVHSREVWLTGEGVTERTPAPPVRDCYRLVCSYAVDGKLVSLGEDERFLDLTKIYPGEAMKGREGVRWAEVAVNVEAARDGEYRLARVNDYFGRLFVNGREVGELKGPWETDSPLDFVVPLKAGMNTVTLKTRAGSSGAWRVAIYLPPGCR